MAMMVSMGTTVMAVESQSINTFDGRNPIIIETENKNSCNHSYNEWEKFREWDIPNSADWWAGTCYKRTIEEYRSCSSCGDMQLRHWDTQLQHTWRHFSNGKTCTRCDYTLNYARIINIIE